MCFVEITYLNPAKEQLTESFLMVHPSSLARVAQSEPQYDGVVQWQKLKGDEEWDVVALYKEVNRFLGDAHFKVLD
jgi:hypothetical protein